MGGGHGGPAGGFALSDVKIQVRLWHGERDPVPVERAEFVAERAPASRLTVWPGEGHCGFIRRWDDVLTAMTEAVD